MGEVDFTGELHPASTSPFASLCGGANLKKREEMRSERAAENDAADIGNRVECFFHDGPKFFLTFSWLDVP